VASRKNLIGVLLIIFLLIQPGMADAGGDEGKLRVVTTITILEDIVKEVGGDRVEVTSIVKGLENPHTYAPSPSDVLALSRADMLVKMGVTGLEPWVNSLLVSAENEGLLVVNATKGIRMRYDDTIGCENPHVWMDPENMKRMVETIKGGLIAADPANRAYYEVNAERYLEELDELEAEIVSKTAAYRGTKVVEVHPAFMYLLDRIGFERVGTIERREGGGVSAQHVALIEDTIKKEDVKLIIDMPQLSSPIVDQIAADTGVAVVELTPLLGPFGTDSYIEMIRYDIDMIVGTLEENDGSGEETPKQPGSGIIAVLIGIFIAWYLVGRR